MELQPEMAKKYPEKGENLEDSLNTCYTTVLW